MTQVLFLQGLFLKLAQLLCIYDSSSRHLAVVLL